MRRCVSDWLYKL